MGFGLILRTAGNVDVEKIHKTHKKFNSMKKIKTKCAFNRKLQHANLIWLM